MKKSLRAGYILIPNLLILTPLSFPTVTLADVSDDNLQQTGSAMGLICVAVFVIAYFFVMVEEFTGLRKSKPVLLGAGIIWLLVAKMAIQQGYTKEHVKALILHDLMEYAELLLFLLVSMTYTNAMTERNVFEVLKVWLTERRFGFRTLFWITGIIAFFLSAIANNLTTALLVGAVVMAFGKENPRFVRICFVNIVVAANAGGAFSPFGDITTLMVWQSGKVGFFQFFSLFPAAVINFVVPALIMHPFLPKGLPHIAESHQSIQLKPGGRRICLLFLLTIAIAIACEQLLYLPPFMGMMVGLSFLMILGYYLKVRHQVEGRFDVFNNVRDAEWDTLIFFFGVVFAVGGLQYIGYLALASNLLYSQLGATSANIVIGMLSSVVDNIPVMFAVLTMNPSMDLYQWQLVTLAAGVGGSLLSVGSAAGVALMGQSKGLYTFIGHLKWMPVILVGYATSIFTHYMFHSPG